MKSESTKYLAGKAIPGSEERTFNLNYAAIVDALGESMVAGTFNIALDEDLEPGRPDIVAANYRFWRCEVATSGMIEKDEPGIPGYLIKVMGENYPSNLAEVLSHVHIRTALKMNNWPSFPVELSLSDSMEEE